jgi:hypothetical protein
MAQPPAIIRLVSAANAPPPTIPGGAEAITWLSDGGFPIANVAGYFAALSNPYDVVFSLPGQYAISITYQIIVFARAVAFSANFAGAKGNILTNPTGVKTWTLNKNGSSCGTIQVSTGGAFTFTSTGGLAVSFAIGDVLSITTPSSPDATLADFAFTLPGLR